MKTVAWFLEHNDRGQLELDPPYQRRSVWNDEYKRYFVDTVLRGYPSPSIFIDVTINPGAPAIYNVVDGKQRLTSLIEFTSDLFDLGSLLRDLDLENTYWSELPATMQKEFLEYALTVETISGSKAELEDAFDRLNRNVARLNAQELRNARFSRPSARTPRPLARSSATQTTLAARHCLATPPPPHNVERNRQHQGEDASQ